MIAVVVIGSMIFAGCDKGGGKVDTEKPIAEVTKEADNMNVKQLKAMVLEYSEAMLAINGDLEAIAKKLDNPNLKINSKEAQEISAEMEAVSESVKALKEQMDVYYNKLKEMKADVSDLKI